MGSESIWTDCERGKSMNWNTSNIFDANGKWVHCKNETLAWVSLDENGWNIRWYQAGIKAAPTTRWRGIDVWSACGVLLQLEARI